MSQSRFAAIYISMVAVSFYGKALRRLALATLLVRMK
jgi:hypothetical protein